MNVKKLFGSVTAVALAVLFAAGSAAYAAAYPQKPITLISPYGAWR